MVVQLDLHYSMAWSSAPEPVPDTSLQGSSAKLGVCLSCSQVSPLGNATPSKRDKKARKDEREPAATIGDVIGWEHDQERSRAATAAQLGDLSIPRTFKRQVELLREGRPE